MSLLKKIGLTLVALLLLVFVWANWNAPEISTTLPEANFVVFQLNKGIESTNDFGLEEIEGIRSNSYNSQTGALSIVFDRKLLQSNDLKSHFEKLDIGFSGALNFESQNGQCPVSGWSLFEKRLKDFFCIRSPKKQNA